MTLASIFFGGVFAYFDQLLFALLPYVALVLFFLVSIARYRRRPFSVSSLSSQFLENRQHFWGLVSFHYGLLTVLLGHLIAFLIPRSVLAWNSVPLRLYILEISGLTFGLLALMGIIISSLRRLGGPRLRVVSTPTDWIMILLILVQVISGVWTAIFHGWGSSWFATTATPYLWSIFTFSPQIDLVTAMPFMVKLHIVTAFLIIGFFPFTRLVHALVMPLMYLNRRNQVVRWWRSPRASGYR
jgi:nitrate reductase gamma subunit